MARFQVSFDKSLALGWSWSAGSCGNDFCIGLPSVCHNEICSTSGERSHRQIRVGLTKRYQIPIRPAEPKDTKSRYGHPRPCFSTILKIGTASQADTCRPHEKIPNPGTACRAKRYQILERSSSPVFFNDFAKTNLVQLRPHLSVDSAPGIVFVSMYFNSFSDSSPWSAALLKANSHHCQFCGQGIFLRFVDAIHSACRRWLLKNNREARRNPLEALALVPQ